MQWEEVYQTPRFHREPPGPGQVWEGLAQMDKEAESGTKRLTQCKDKEAEAGGWRDLSEASWPLVLSQGHQTSLSAPLQTGSLRPQGRLGSWYVIPRGSPGTLS